MRRAWAVAALLAALAVAAAVAFGEVPWGATRLLGLVAAAGLGLGLLGGAARLRRARLGALGALVLAAVALVFSAAPSAPAVYLVVIDCLSAGRLDPALLPRTWALVERSARFDHAHAQSSWTRSAVASLLTGTWPRDHGLYTLKPQPDRVRDGVPRLAAAFRDAGWSTAAFVDQAQLDPAFGLAEGFDRFNFRDGDALHLQDRHRRWHRFFRHAPRFVYLHYLDAHKPFEPAPAWRPAPVAQLDVADWGALMAEVNRGERALTDAEWAELRARHEAELRQLDAALGELWDELSADGTLDHAWVVLTADHGEAFGEHGWLTHGGTPWETLLRVPLVLRPPGGTEGRVLPGRPRQVDVLPTLLGFAGLPVPAGAVGVDLGPALSGRPVGRLPSYAEFRGDGEVELAVAVDRWKYLVGPRGERLFDLDADPAEAIDLAPTHPAALAAMRAEAERYRAGEGAAAERVAPGEATWEALRALGYVE